MEDPVQIISDGDPTELKSLVEISFKNVETRYRWANSLELWKAVFQRLRALSPVGTTDDSKSPHIALLQLINNLCTISAATSNALETGMHVALIGMSTNEGIEERLRWQILANLSTHLTEGNSSEMVDALCEATDAANYPIDIALLLPRLVLIKNMTIYPSSKPYLISHMRHGDLKFVLTTVSTWFGVDSFERISLVSLEIMSKLIELGLMTEWLEENQLAMDETLSLLKLLDALFASRTYSSKFQNQGFWNSTNCKSLALTMVKLMDEHTKLLLPYVESLNRSSPDAIAQWESVCLLSNLLTSVAPTFSEELLSHARDCLLKDLVTLLKSAKSLPRISKLSALDEETEPNSEDFPHLKSSLISLITILVRKNSAAQDYVRTSGGLLAVLENCIIDANNPFIKEKAILCIKYLLENNSENQALVAEMEAKKTVEAKDLEKAGYETEIVDGKLVLKRSEQP